MSGQFDRFTERARKVLTLAQEEAKRFNHNYIGTEHLLLGLVREGEGVAAKVLSNLGVQLTEVRTQVENSIGRGEREVRGDIGLTPRAKKVIELAVDEARRLGHHYIGTEHLLLGLIREGEGVAAGALLNLGVNLEKVRAEVIKVLTQTGSVPHMREGSLRGTHGPGQTRGFRPGTVRQPWEYRVVSVEWKDGAPIVPSIGGSPADQAELHTALGLLGADGWELAAVDHSWPDPLPPGALYIFKRRRRSE
jgi:ATP-dependent Clp protease ATP-binding subunit ClpA